MVLALAGDSTISRLLLIEVFFILLCHVDKRSKGLLDIAQIILKYQVFHPGISSFFAWLAIKYDHNDPFKLF